MIRSSARSGPIRRGQIECALGSDQARQTLGSAGARNDSARHLGQAERRVLGGDAEIAGERDLEATRQTMTVYGGDDGFVDRKILRDAAEAGHQLRAPQALCRAETLVEIGDSAQVGTGTE